MLSEKAQRIIHVLLANPGSFITAKTLSSMLGLSERTVNTYLKEVAGFCETQGITYVSRRGIGIRLELTPKTEKHSPDISDRNLSTTISRNGRTTSAGFCWRAGKTIRLLCSLKNSISPGRLSAPI